MAIEEGSVRRWRIIKRDEIDYSAFGILIEGPRCDDEVLVSLRDVVEALRRAAEGRAHEVVSPYHAADFIEREFGGGQ